jgi:death-on-curing protein
VLGAWLVAAPFALHYETRSYAYEAIGNDVIIEVSRTSEPGISDRGDIEYVLEYVEEDHFGEGPVTIHEKAFQLLRLLVANHPFVDGNKRTAVGTVMVFYFFNGYDPEYAEELEAMVRRLAVRESLLAPVESAEYLSEVAVPRDLDDEWTFEIVFGGVSGILDEYLDEL